MDRVCKVLTVGATLLVSLILAGCTDQKTAPQQSSGINDYMTGEFDLSIPERLKVAREVDLNALFAIITVNGGEPQRWQESTPFTTTFTVNKGDMLNMEIRWYETLQDSSELLLATNTVSQIINGNTSLVVDESDYRENYDDDSDGFFNLVERTLGSNPYDENSTPLNLPDVRIRQIDPLNAPQIDGLYDQSWNNATFGDVNGDPLSIDNLMIGQGALRPDGDAEMRWFAMHDNVYLYVFVLGENVDMATPHRDSSEVWHDDTLSIFIDGDGSKLQTYDGIDDRQIMTPLMPNPTNLTSNSILFVVGSNSAPVPPFEFATCLCLIGQHTWELRLKLSDFGIVKNRVFGLDLQLDLDHDGGDRDAKWGWFHPSRTTRDVDNTWRNPSFMGRAIIE